MFPDSCAILQIVRTLVLSLFFIFLWLKMLFQFSFALNELCISPVIGFLIRDTGIPIGLIVLLLFDIWHGQTVELIWKAVNFFLSTYTHTY